MVLLAVTDDGRALDRRKAASLVIRMGEEASQLNHRDGFKPAPILFIVNSLHYISFWRYSPSSNGLPELSHACPLPRDYRGHPVPAASHEFNELLIPFVPDVERLKDICHFIFSVFLEAYCISVRNCLDSDPRFAQEIPGLTAAVSLGEKAKSLFFDAGHEAVNLKAVEICREADAALQSSLALLPQPEEVPNLEMVDALLREVL